jgi:two-component system, cell cycle sensor histidine kinase and response regulator CckA
MGEKPTYEEMKQRIKELENEGVKRRLTEKALQKNEDEMRAILDAVAETIVLIDRQGMVIMANQTVCERLGVKKEDFIGHCLYDFFPPEVAEKRRRKLEVVFETGKPVSFEDNRKGMFFEHKAYPVLSSGDRVEKVVSFARDISERKQAEAALRKSEERYRTLVDNLPVAVYRNTPGPEGQFLMANSAFCNMFGFKNEEEVKKVAPADLYANPKERKQYSDELIQKGVLKNFARTLLNKDGTPVHTSITSRVVYGKDREVSHFDSIMLDITDQKKLEAQLQQAQKMEALGTLGGGIAHDFNNLLMGIQGRTSLMLMDKDSSHPDFEHLKGIEKYVKSAADLTKQLLGFARGGKYEVKPTDINELLKKSSRMFGRTKKEIKIHEKYQKDVWTVETDQSQIEQVLMNLYVNAWQAMPGGGELYIQTENVSLDEGYVNPFKIGPGRYVKISVTDTGIGMDEDIQQRIFDPFFTTKEMGRGTGLGLASVYGIIKNHGGFINVYSEKGEGTTFNIYLPTSEKEFIEERELSEDMLRGSETVLLVDDEDMIIDVGEQILQKLGYEVLIAGSGKEATEIYEKDKDKIDMVILDMVMPDMGGGDTFDRLKEINPHIKVLLSSGYSINGRATEILDRGCNGFIHKPFNMKQLSRKLRDILDKE